MQEPVHFIYYNLTNHELDFLTILAAWTLIGLGLLQLVKAIAKAEVRKTYKR